MGEPRGPVINAAISIAGARKLALASKAAGAFTRRPLMTRRVVGIRLFALGKARPLLRLPRLLFEGAIRAAQTACPGTDKVREAASCRGRSISIKKPPRGCKSAGRCCRGVMRFARARYRGPRCWGGCTLGRQSRGCIFARRDRKNLASAD